MAFNGGFGSGDRPRASRSGDLGARASERDGRGGNATAARGPEGGAVPAYDHPSAGQVLSALGNAAALGTGSVLGLIGNVATSDEYGRTPLGRAFDAATGGVPEAPDRWEAPREKYNLDARGEQRRLLDRTDAAPGTADDALATGDGSDAAPSDVLLQDRRRPYGLYAGTTLLARRA